MSPMLVVKRRMSIIKQLGKRDNARQSPRNITQLSKNNNFKNVIKSVFYINFHHGPIKVKVEEGSDVQKDGFIASKGQYPKLMEG
jgi:hypothetical protein